MRFYVPLLFFATPKCARSVQLGQYVMQGNIDVKMFGAKDRFATEAMNEGDVGKSLREMIIPLKMLAQKLLEF